MMISQASMALLMRILLASTPLAERPAGLTSLFESNAMDDRGVITLRISERITRGSRNALLVRQVVGMRSAKRVGLLVELENLGDAPWAPRSLVVLEIGGEDLEASVWPADAIPPGGRRSVFIEAEASDEQAQGTYVLKLSEDGPRAVTLGNVTFPRFKDRQG
jgi:uncharacterized protein (TIGR02268 family)